MLYPALTTAELPYQAMGSRAARLLLDMLETPPIRTEPQVIRVAGQVVMRQSLVSLPSENATSSTLKGG